MTSWIYIAQMLARYAGIFLFFFNFFGGIMKIIVFSKRRPYRTNPCIFFMLISAVAGCVQLLNATVARILATGFNIDLTRTSLILCKLRQYSYGAAPGIAIVCDWLSTIDQFLVTSRSVRLRRLSNMKLAYCVAIIVILFWTVHGIPFFIFTQIRSGVCLIDNFTFQIYYIYVYFSLFYTTFPVIILITFGTLAYRNMRMLTNIRRIHGADRQLTLMVFTQVGLILITVMPTTIFNMYSISTSQLNKTTEQIGIEYLIVNIVGFIGTFEFGGSFYLFLVISSRFRQQVKQCFCCFRPTRGRVEPMIITVRPVPR